MGDKRLDEENLNESYTEFGQFKAGYGATGATTLSSFFGKFFSRRGRKFSKGGRLAGDAATASETFEGVPGIGVSRGLPKLPQVEYERKRRYKEYEDMDEYPEIGAALDIYADDSSQKNIVGDIFEVKTENEQLSVVVTDFLETSRLKEFIWDIIRNVCKYGDCFIENIVDLNNSDAGIQRIKILNPNYVSRVENQYGYLQNFLQEVPEAKSSFLPDPSQGMGQGTGKYIKLDKEQIVHFRTHTSDPNYYPY